MRQRERRMSFGDIYEQAESELYQLAHSYRQRVIGMSPDDIHAEMMVCLWKARRTWKRDTGVPFMSYFYAIWVRRKADLISFQLAQRRDVRMLQLVDDISETITESDLEQFGLTVTQRDIQLLELPPLPVEYTDTEKRVWFLIGSGMDPKVIAKTIGKRAYDTIVEAWRDTPEVKFLLEAAGS